MDFETLRKQMVEDQLIFRGIKDKKVLDAFYKVPRHKFVSEDVIKSAYSDYPLSIGEGQTISQPYMVALMTELLDIKIGERVLEIGTGSGYQTAILAELAKEVYSLERISSLGEQAKERLRELGYNNINLRISDGTQGWKEFSTFDKIIITAAASKIPEPLLDQLGDPGRLIIPIGPFFNQILTMADKKQKDIHISQSCACVFVPLIGKYA